MEIRKYKLISVHGGHSGEFCSHAEDKLEDIIKEYIKQKFYAVGITEHTPPFAYEFMYEEERALGFSVENLYERFERYFKEVLRLKKKYKQKIKIYAGFETETYTGFETHIKSLTKKFKPDYFVGSIHHTNDIEIDYSKEKFDMAVKKAGNIDRLYEDYFDQQNEMIKKLKPKIIGHFDVIRIFDKDYKKRFENKKIKSKILRNLDEIKKNNSLIEINMRSVYKGAKEPFPCKTIRNLIYKKNISVIMSDDSHGIDSVGAKIKEGMAIIINENGTLIDNIFTNR